MRRTFTARFSWLFIVFAALFAPMASSQPTGAADQAPPPSAATAAPPTPAEPSAPPAPALPAPAAGAAPSAPDGPAEVEIGIYVNDINSIDLRAHTYVMDLYIWFRWSDPSLSPGDTFEFMNRTNPDVQIKTQIYAEPLAQPDGKLYQLFRYQGAFSNKFPIGLYPFDRQTLHVFIEDQDMGSDEFRYVVDEVSINPEIVLPGFRVEGVELTVADRPYDTAFGDRAEADVNAYSRASLDLNVSRPWLSGATKTLLPMLLIILCSAAALLLGAQHVEARIGLAITSLLALVALQFSMQGTLPEVGYLLMLDQIYIASYAFVLATIAVIVRDKRAADRADREGGDIMLHGWWGALAAVTLYAVVVGAIIWGNLMFPAAESVPV